MNRKLAFEAGPPPSLSSDDEDEDDEEQQPQQAPAAILTAGSIPDIQNSSKGTESDRDSLDTPTHSLLRDTIDSSSSHIVTVFDKKNPSTLDDLSADTNRDGLPLFNIDIGPISDNTGLRRRDTASSSSSDPSNPNFNLNPMANPNNLFDGSVAHVSPKTIERKTVYSSVFNQCRDPNCTSCPPELHEWRRAKEMSNAKSKKLEASTIPGGKLSLSQELKQFDEVGSDSDNDDEDDGNFFRKFIKGIKRMSKPKKVWAAFEHGWESAKQLLNEPINPSGAFYLNFSRIFVATMLLSFGVDPLFFFVVAVNEEYQCAYTSWYYLNALVALRSCFDFFYFLHILIQFRVTYVMPSVPQRNFFTGTLMKSHKPGDLVNNFRDIRLNYLATWFTLDVFALLPVPQIIALGVIPAVGGGPASLTSSVLRLLVLVQYIPRIRRCVPLLRGSDTTGLLFESAWASFFLNLVMYVMSSHVIGSLWYLGAVQRWDECATEFCNDFTGPPACDVSYLTCPNSLDTLSSPSNSSSLAVLERLLFLATQSNSSLSLQTQCGIPNDNPPFDYGLYQQAVQLLLEDRAFVKYIYSLQWGFTQISTLGGNQIPSTFVPEVFFMLTITAGGLLLFAVLIGNIQSFLQSLTRRTFEYQLQRRDVENWMIRRKIPGDLAKQVRKLGRLQWSANRGVDDNEILDILSEDLQRDIRRVLCLELISHSELLQAMDDSVKDVICRRMVRRIYPAGTKIIHEGELVDRMFFVKKGFMVATNSRMHSSQMAGIKEGEFFGEELLIAYLEEEEERPGRWRRSSSGHLQSYSGRTGLDILPRSEREIKCVDNVEGFTLEAGDIEFICIQFRASFERNRGVQRALNKCSHLRRSRAASSVQLIYRYRLRKRLGMNLEYFDLVSKDRASWGKAVKFALENPGKKPPVLRLNQQNYLNRPRNIPSIPPSFGDNK